MMQGDCDIRHILVAFAVANHTSRGRDFSYKGTRVVVSLVLCCGEPTGGPECPPDMVPPAEPPPNLTLPRMDAFQGFLPVRPVKPPAKPQQPAHRARKAQVKSTRGSGGYPPSRHKGRAHLVGRAPAATPRHWPAGMSSVADTSTAAEPRSRASSASSAASVRRPPQLQPMRTPTPPPPPPPKAAWCAASWTDYYSTHATAHTASSQNPRPPCLRTLQPNRKVSNLRPPMSVPGVRRRSDPHTTTRSAS